jgi:hypothetical protein
MEAPLITAIAALSGSAIGGAASFLSSWLGHDNQVRARLFLENKNRREELYREFIEEASQSYIDAMTRDTPDLPKTIRLYALISRMRVLSSQQVIARAETVARSIVDSYPEPNKTFDELRLMMNELSMDPLREFAEACRSEIHLSAAGFRPPALL